MPDDHKRYAIIVGVSTYEDDFAQLPLAAKDAVRVQSVLEEHAGFDRDTVYVLSNGTDVTPGTKMAEPTRPNVLQRLRYVCDEAGPDDLIVFYFAGHGAEISHTPYLITSDTKMDVARETGLNVDEVNDMLNEANCRCVLRIFDACRSPFGQGRGDMGRMTEGFVRALMGTARGWASFCSCSSGEVARESSEFEQGVFSYYLCEGLCGKAANQDGIVTFDSLTDYVRISVKNWCDRQSQKQTPHLRSDLSGPLVLVESVRPQEAASCPPTSPFFALTSGIDQHLSSSAADTRRLTFTNEEEWRTILVRVHEELEAALNELHHPAIRVEIRAATPVQNSTHIWDAFRSDLVATSLRGEFRHNCDARRVDLLSDEVIVPQTHLHVALARFEFFYWLWFCHVCDADRFRGSFHPNPPLTKGFFTFKPSGARDSQKTQEALKELLARASDDIVEWAKQIGDYVETRVKRVRETGPIIE